jgi:hypothetical protein
MASGTNELTDVREDESVLAWRTQRLEDAGFERLSAAEIAKHRGFDLHALLDLIDRGCPPELAARIVHPLE